MQEPKTSFRVRFREFSKIALPITFVTILVPTLWILIRYFWLNF